MPKLDSNTSLTRILRAPESVKPHIKDREEPWETEENVMKIRCFGVILAMLSASLLPVPDRSFPGGDFLMPRKANAGERSSAPPERTMPPARTPEIAVAEEYEIAQRRGTAESLKLFIARHPDSALAEQARTKLKQMKR